MNRTELFLKKHSSTILVVIGSAGVVATTVLAIKATPLAIQLIEDEKNRQNRELIKEAERNGQDMCNQISHLKPLEVVKVAWKPYIPTVITGAATIACIAGSRYLSMKQEAYLMSAYALLNESYRGYSNKVKELNEGKADIDAKQEIIRSLYEKDKTINNDKVLELNDGDTLFFDYQSMRFFWSNINKVMEAENAFLEDFNDRGYTCLNEYYDLLGIPRVDYGYQLGWYWVENNDPYNCHELEINYEKVYISDGLECCIITMSNPPMFDYVI